VGTTVTYVRQGVEFEWDSDKAELNLTKHDVTFQEAAEVFFDPWALWRDASTIAETREAWIGYSLSYNLLFVVYVERGVRNRIISARQATNHERRRYEENRT
jgi:uncharacterized DUF497 family protein